MFGRYRVKRKLGGGGMGVVYLVENTELQRDEALKMPHFGADDDPQARERFLREARAAAGLDHPNLCPVYHVGEQDGVCFLTMRYLQGRPLSGYTAQAQPPRMAAEIVTKLAQALEYAHGKGVIHRDLKPSNVMMCSGVGPVVVDFGLAKQTRQPDRQLTQSGAVLGTPAYMSPEQVKAEVDRIGPASDVYSLGVILYELLTGRELFQGTSQAEIFAKVLYADPPPPSDLRPGLGPELDAICRKAVAKAPEQRYATMKAFAAALVDYLRAGPATEGPGKLAPAPAVPADIFQLPTVPPGQAPPAATPRRGQPVPVGRLVSSPPAAAARKPAGVPREGRPRGVLAGVLGCLGLLVLVVLGLGGLAALSLRTNRTDSPRAFAAETMRSTPVPPAPSVADTAPKGGLGFPGGPPDGAGGTTGPAAPGARPAPLDCTGTLGVSPAAVRQAQAAWAKYLGRQVEEDDEIAPGVKIQFVLVPPAKFLMGSPEGEQDRSPDEVQHEVTLTEPFYLGKCEVTQAQYEAVVGQGNNPSNFKGADLPVESVTWTQASEYADSLTKKRSAGLLYRLPTEAEWEYSCRGGRLSSQPFGIGDGTSLSSDEASFDGNYPYGGAAKGKYPQKTSPVGSYPSNAFGLHDMHGNVWEWCADWYGPYPVGNVTNPTGPAEGSLRVLRGGCWYGIARSCRAACRNRNKPGFRDFSLGFRLARRVPSGGK